jgi:hypothetical protein
MSESRLNTPVALIIFNRPDTTERVFEQIAKARPRKLLVVGDGPRPAKAGEAEKVAQARAIVEKVDWDCEVITDFATENLGCRRRVSTGIDWVFQMVERAIILEDDCVPSPSFFRYCEDLLERYADEERVFSISGDNFLNRRYPENHSYYFSRYPHPWGWASWRRAWKHYDVTMSAWPGLRDSGWLARQFGTENEVRYWSRIFDAVHAGAIDTWDYQLFFAAWQREALIAVPAVNLISNIGFGLDATHTKFKETGADMAIGQLDFPLRHPAEVSRDIRADRATNDRMFARPPLRRLVWRAERAIRIVGSAAMGRLKSVFPS